MLNPLSPPFIPPSKQPQQQQLPATLPFALPSSTVPTDATLSSRYQDLEGEKIWDLAKSPVVAARSSPSTKPSPTRAQALEDPLSGTSTRETDGLARSRRRVTGVMADALRSELDLQEQGTTMEAEEESEDEESEELFTYPSSPASQLHDLPSSRSDSPHPTRSSRSPTSSSTPTQASFPSTLLIPSRPPAPPTTLMPTTKTLDIKPLLISAIQAGELYRLERLFSSHSDSAFSLANEPLNRHTQITPLHAASTHGRLPIVKFLVDECGAILEMEDTEGETALHKASLRGHLGVVSFLVKDKGVNPHLRDHCSFTALHNAASRGFLDIVRFLCTNSSAASYDSEESLDAGVGRVRGVDRRSSNGWTPLMCAAADGHLPTVLYLLTKQAADPLVRNNAGETAFDVSAGVFESHICDLLEFFESDRWPSPSTPRAEPYNLLSVHLAVPIIVYEHQRLDTRLKTAARNAGRPTFSASGLGKLGRRSPFELKYPTGSRLHADDAATSASIDTRGSCAPCLLQEIDLPSLEKPFVMPLPSNGAFEVEEKAWFWLSDWVLCKSDPRADPVDGWSYSHRFSAPSDQWTSSPTLLSTQPSPPGTQEVVAEQGSSNIVRRRVWVRIMRRRFEIPSLPLLDPDGMTLGGFRPDGGKISEGSDGEEMGTFVRVEPNDGQDYLARAEFMVGRSEGTDEGESRTPSQGMRRLGKLEGATAELRTGLKVDNSLERKMAAGRLLDDLSEELDQLRLAARSFPGSDTQSAPSSASESFIYPSSSPDAAASFPHLPSDVSAILAASETFSVPMDSARLISRRGIELIPTIPRAVWEPDSVDCRRCGRKFTFLLRRHHCRRCGSCVCHSCSSKRSVLPADEIVLDPSTPFSSLSDELHVPHRVCDPCFQHVASSASSSAAVSLSMGMHDSVSTLASHAASTRSESNDFCPVCSRSLADLESTEEREHHIQACLDDPGRSSILDSNRYLVYELKPDSPLIGVECQVCLEDFEVQTRVARLPCLCSFHDSCLKSWLSRGRACPIHARG